MPSTRNTKRQTRLAFTPLPSSSPQASKLPSSLHSRAAAIGYDGIGTPTKMRKLAHLPGSGSPAISSSSTTTTTTTQPKMSFSPFTRRSGAPKHQSYLLPTPEASSQARNGQSVSASDFEVHASSDSDSSLPSVDKLLTTPTKPKTTPLKSATTPSKSIITPSKSITTPSKPTNGKKIDTPDDEEDDILPTRPARAAAPYHIVISSDEDSDDEILPLSSPQRRTASTSTPTSTSRKLTVITPPKETSPYFSPRRTRSSRIAQPPPSTNGSARRSNRLQSRKSIVEAGKDETTTPLDDDSDDSDIVTPTRSRRTGKHPRRKTSDSGASETSGDVERSPTKKTRLMRPVKESISPRKMSKQEEEDLEEDLEILQDTEVRDDRTRGRAVPTKRRAQQKQLDILRARHGGQTSSPPADLGPSSSRVIHDTESESGEEESDEDDPGVNTIHPEENDDYDKDFVVEDDDDTLGAPLEDIPLQFTRHAHKKLKEHFKDAVEWMVQNKLNPAFARDDPVYRVAFYKLEDEVKGYAGSKFVSAAWVGDFARALKARPQYNDADIPRAGRVYNSCDACNKTNHPAKFMITFSGKPYHPDTLETLSDDEDEDDERDEDDRRSRDANGNPIPPVDKQYFVGRFCKANAARAHSLLHWRFHLNEWVLDWLKTEGHTSPEKLIERDSWSTKRRREYANKIVDEMEEKKEIKALWRDFKITVDEARSYKGERFR